MKIDTQFGTPLQYRLSAILLWAGAVAGLVIVGCDLVDGCIALRRGHACITTEPVRYWFQIVGLSTVSLAEALIAFTIHRSLRDPLSEPSESRVKLDLAKAYLAMGDSDQALSLLREVANGGADIERKKAIELIQRTDE